MINENLQNKLIKLLKLFQNRPNHLAKYLIDNNAFNEIFIKNIINSKKLDDIENILPDFKNIEEINNFFNFFDDSYKSKKKQEKSLEELTEKLEEYIKAENYEDAIRIRNYIRKIRKNKLL